MCLFAALNSLFIYLKATSDLMVMPCVYYFNYYIINYIYTIYYYKLLYWFEVKFLIWRNWHEQVINLNMWNKEINI